MEWQARYKEKVVTAKEASEKIKAGDRVIVGHAVGEPKLVIGAMAENKESYGEVEIVNMVGMGKGTYAREALNSAREDLTTCFFSEMPRLFRDEYLKVNVAIIQVSEPDEHSFCSFGVSSGYTKVAAECADIVIAEVNKKMPRVLGDNFIQVKDIDYMVEADYKVMEVKKGEIGDVENEIGRNCSLIIEDGSTLQLGIGAIPDAVLLNLKNKKDLGIHSEMISDGVVDLVEAGVINNKRKTIHKNKIVTTFLMGTKKLYNFANNNPMIDMLSVDYVNDPCVISQNDRMVSINSCTQIDLMGQIALEPIELKQFSGACEQVEFIRGANKSKGGKAIIAVQSTDFNGNVSRIVPLIDNEATASTSRTDVHYVVTEYGIAELRGKTLKERGRALINIAHPKFRKELIKEWSTTLYSN